MAVGRFQVMAVLQAARAYVLGLPMESALSWGLNRAIFIAAAKRGFKGISLTGRDFGEAKARPEEEAVDIYRLGDDMAYKEVREGKLYFAIGGRVQTEEDFRRQVESRFQGAFAQAWEEALKIVRAQDPITLKSGRAFYDLVYRPLRDELAARWTRLGERGAEARAAEGVGRPRA